MVKIRLRRLGATKRPFYRVVVADSRSPRDGRFIEAIGRYEPMQEPSLVEIDSDRALHWLAVGARPTGQVRRLLQVSGVWERFESERPKTAAKLVESEPKPGARTSDRWTRAQDAAKAAKAAEAAPPAAPAPAAPAAVEAPAEDAPAASDAPAEDAAATSDAPAEEAQPESAESETPAAEPSEASDEG
ncbi:MAG TPA: 30S ribosomal protein S16 [Actinomycetota bacterium]|nr:30S ribosomal protein S16 [Actinomycetota bacterium]